MWTSNDDGVFSKIRDFQSTYNVTASNPIPSKYIYPLDQRVTLHRISRDSVGEIIDPFGAKHDLREFLVLSDLLVGLGIKRRDIGLIGSNLVREHINLDSQPHDVDVIVRGSYEQNIMRDFWFLVEPNSSIRSYASPDLTPALYQRRRGWISNYNSSNLASEAGTSIGRLDGRHFNVCFVRGGSTFLDELEITAKGLIDVDAKVIDDSNAKHLPARYLLRVQRDHGKNKILEDTTVVLETNACPFANLRINDRIRVRGYLLKFLRGHPYFPEIQDVISLST